MKKVLDELRGWSDACDGMVTAVVFWVLLSRGVE